MRLSPDVAEKYQIAPFLASDLQNMPGPLLGAFEGDMSLFTYVFQGRCLAADPDSSGLLVSCVIIPAIDQLIIFLFSLPHLLMMKN